MTGLIAPLVGLGLGLGLAQASLPEPERRVEKPRSPAGHPRDYQGFEWTARKFSVRKAIAEALAMPDATIAEVKGYLRLIQSNRVLNKKDQAAIDDLLRLEAPQLHEYAKTVPKVTGKFETSEPQRETVKIDSNTDGFLRNRKIRKGRDESYDYEEVQVPEKKTKVDTNQTNQTINTTAEPSTAKPTTATPGGGGMWDAIRGVWNSVPQMMIPNEPQDQMQAPVGGDPLIDVKAPPAPPNAIERLVVYRMVSGRPEEIDPREFLNPQPGPTIAETMALGGEPDPESLPNYYAKLHAMRNKFELLPESEFRAKINDLPPEEPSAFSRNMGFALTNEEQREVDIVNEKIRATAEEARKNFTDAADIARQTVTFQMVGNKPQSMGANYHLLPDHDESLPWDVLKISLDDFAHAPIQGSMVVNLLKDLYASGGDIKTVSTLDSFRMMNKIKNSKPGEVFQLPLEDFLEFSKYGYVPPKTPEFPVPNIGQPIPTAFSRPVLPPYPVPAEITVDPNATPALNLSRVAAAAAWDISKLFAQGGGAYLAANTFGPAAGLFYNAAFSRLAPALDFLDRTRGYSENVGEQISRDFIRPLARTVIPPSAHATQILNPLQTQTDTARTSVNVQDVYAIPATDGISLGQQDFQSWYLDTYSQFAVR